jgi:hypothetical protein
MRNGEEDVNQIVVGDLRVIRERRMTPIVRGEGAGIVLKNGFERLCSRELQSARDSEEINIFLCSQHVPHMSEETGI